MPSPTTIQPHEATQLSNVNTYPKAAERKRAGEDLFLKFVKRELKHWQIDLKKRQREGEYYMEWLEWADSTSAAEISSLSLDFQELISQEIPSISKLIYNLSASMEDWDTNRLLMVQQAYTECCSRYDQIRLNVLSEMNWKGDFQIF